ncbi:MAG: TlyA family RNA methyltransferase [Opitutales bacterium]|nr:TlyA family RNA methyltransferase [Opitutales bacterium]
MKKIGKKRLDELLVLQGHCESRAQAKALILAGQIWKGTERLDKASRSLTVDAPVFVKTPLKYVGRGGLKMENFLKDSQINPSGMSVLDLGASTGGFTDCLLQMGARQAICVDVGHGQLHYKLRIDERVQNFEKVNLRHLSKEDIEGAPFPLVVMDLSFISLQKVLPQAWNFVAAEGILISLVKPQFECTREEASESKGVIRSNETHERVKKEILAFSREQLEGSSLIQEKEASPHGSDGNLEYFLAWKKKGD